MTPAEQVAAQPYAALLCLYAGIVCGIVYDLFRLVRRLWRTKPQRRRPAGRCENPYRRFYTNDNSASQLARAARARRAERSDRQCR